MGFGWEMLRQYFCLALMFVFMIKPGAQRIRKKNLSHLAVINFSILELRLTSLVESGNSDRHLFETLQKHVVIYELLHAGHRSDQLHSLQNLLQKIELKYDFESD